MLLVTTETGQECGVSSPILTIVLANVEVQAPWAFEQWNSGTFKCLSSRHGPVIECSLSLHD